MKFPYGISNFGKIVTEGYFYVDRTSLIPAIEDAGDQLLYLRPRRFGKSLLLSMLEHYYDLAKADEFERTFGHLDIGKKATQLHSQYFVLKWDFSEIASEGSSAEIKQALYNHINGRIADFANNYSSYYQRPIKIYEQDAIASLHDLLRSISSTGKKLYLLIDEYDNFANQIVMGRHGEGHERYKDLLAGEGILKTVFKAIKASSAGRGLDRVFITGVSPIVLSDLTSGYNVAESISLEPEFQTLCGFTEKEIQQVLEEFSDQNIIKKDQVQEGLALMRSFYNGYCFCSLYTDPDYEAVYNPTMALYFLKYLQKSGKYPEEMLDNNLAIDRDKLAYIANLPSGSKVIEAAVEGQPPLTLRTLVQRFGIEDVLYGQKDQSFMVSLLYFFGVLTLSGKDNFGEFCFSVPNQVIFKLYLETLREHLFPEWEANDIKWVRREFYSKGELKGICEVIEGEMLPVFSNRDYAHANELMIKTIFLLLVLDDTYYQIYSEKEVGHGHADLVLLVRPNAREYGILDFVLEFKYVSLKALKLSAEEVKQLDDAACRELKPVQSAFAEAKKQLVRYSRDLKAEYGILLNLRSFAVVALGLERLVWLENGELKIEN